MSRLTEDLIDSKINFWGGVAFFVLIALGIIAATAVFLLNPPATVVGISYVILVAAGCAGFLYSFDSNLGKDFLRLQILTGVMLGLWFLSLSFPPALLALAALTVLVGCGLAIRALYQNYQRETHELLGSTPEQITAPTDGAPYQNISSYFSPSADNSMAPDKISNSVSNAAEAQETSTSCPDTSSTSSSASQPSWCGWFSRFKYDQLPPPVAAREPGVEITNKPSK